MIRCLRLPNANFSSILIAGIGGIDTVQRISDYPGPCLSKPGFMLGYYFAGKVEKVGPKVSWYKTGDVVARMYVFGAYTTHIILSVANAIKLKVDDDMIKATALPLNYMIVYGILKRSEAKLGPRPSILIGQPRSTSELLRRSSTRRSYYHERDLLADEIRPRQSSQGDFHRPERQGSKGPYPRAE